MPAGSCSYLSFCFCFSLSLPHNLFPFLLIYYSCSWMPPMGIACCQLFQRSISFVLTSQRLKSQMTYGTEWRVEPGGKKQENENGIGKARRKMTKAAAAKWVKCQKLDNAKLSLQTCSNANPQSKSPSESESELPCRGWRRVSWANKIILQPVNANWAAWRWANAFPIYSRVYPVEGMPVRKSCLKNSF